MSHGHPPALFVADSQGIDFLNSIATPTDTPIDWLDDGKGLLAWLDQAGLVPSETLTELNAQAMPGELDAVAAQARGLREWFRSFVSQGKGRPLTAGDLNNLAPLNRLLERDEGYFTLAPVRQEKDTAIALRLTRRWRSPESLLLPIGVAMAKVIAEEDFTNIKACEGASCTLMFADHTRGRLRRWCSMAVCGNRAKAASHRQRLKTEN
jgi:predicted RNA-binding Zn ribbon-like protein